MPKSRSDRLSTRFTSSQNHNNDSSQSVAAPSNIDIIVLIRPEKKSLSLPFNRATSWDRLVQTLYKLYVGHNTPGPQCSLARAYSCIRVFCVDSGAEILPEFWSELLRPAMSIEVEFLSPFLSPPWDSTKFSGSLFADDEDIVMGSTCLTENVRGLLEYGSRVEDGPTKMAGNPGMLLEKGLLTPGSPSARSSISTQTSLVPSAESKTSSCTSYFESKVGPWSQQMAIDSNFGDTAAMLSTDMFRSGYTFRDSRTPASIFGDDISPSASHMPSLVSSPMQPAPTRAPIPKGFGYPHALSQALAPRLQTPPASPFVGPINATLPDDHITQTSPGTSNGSSSTKRKRTWSEATTLSTSERSTASPKPISNGRMSTRQTNGNNTNARNTGEDSQSPKRPRISPNSKSGNNSHKRQQQQQQQSTEKKNSNNNTKNGNDIANNKDAECQTTNNNNQPRRERQSATPPQTGVVIERALLLDSLSAGEFIKIIRASDGSLIALREDEDYEVVMERRKSETKAMSDLAKERELKVASSEKKRKRGADDDVNDLIRIWSGGGAEKKRKAVVFDKLTAEEKIMLQKLVREQFIIRIDHFTAPVIDEWKAKHLPNAEHDQITGYIVDVAKTVYNTEIKRKSAYRSFLELHGLS